MKKVKIDFHIKGLDVETKFKTTGEFKNSRLIFIDNEQNTNYLIMHKDMIEYYKTGSVKMRYKFTVNNITKGTYEVLGSEFVFNIETTVIKKTNSSIHIEFNLYQGNDLINKNILDITYQEE